MPYILEKDDKDNISFRPYSRYPFGDKPARMNKKKRKHKQRMIKQSRQANRR